MPRVTGPAAASARRSPHGCWPTARRCSRSTSSRRTSRSRGVTYLETDVTDPASVAAAFRAIDSRCRADRHPGQQCRHPARRADRQDLLRRLLGGDRHASQRASSCAPRKRCRAWSQRGKGGAIVSIASTAAFVGLPGRGPYCAAKAGILGLTRALALEVASAGIRVNAVAPGFTRTKFIEQGLADGSLQEDWMVARVPMQRLAATEEIANGGALPGRRRILLHDRAEPGRRRRLDRPGHPGRADLAADAGDSDPRSAQPGGSIAIGHAARAVPGKAALLVVATTSIGPKRLSVGLARRSTSPSGALPAGCWRRGCCRENGCYCGFPTAANSPWFSSARSRPGWCRCRPRRS